MARKQLQAAAAPDLTQLDPITAAAVQAILDNQNLLFQIIRNIAKAQAGLNPIIAIDGSHLNALSVTDAQIGNLNVGKLIGGFIAAGLIAAASLDVTKLSIKQIIIPNLVLTNNSPGAGQVAWASCLVYFNGATYSIASGNCATTDMQIYWDVGGGTFSSAPTFTPSQTRYGIATNTKGVGDAVWNKLGTSGVQETHLSFGLITGIQVQPVASLAVDPTVIGTTTVLNITNVRGAVLSVGAFVTTNITGGTGAFCDFQYTIDGLTPVAIPIIANSSPGVPSWSQASACLAQNLAGTGGTASDHLSFSMGFGFSQSLKVEAVVGNTSAQFTGGMVNFYVLYASKAN